MILYLVLPLLCLLTAFINCSVYYTTRYRRHNVTNITIIGVILIIINILRGQRVGFDTTSYMDHFTNIANRSFFGAMNYYWEKGFSFLCKVLSYISKNPRIIIIVCGIIGIGGVMLYIYKYSKIPWLSLFIYISMGYYAYSFNIIRQCVALAIVIYSIRYIYSRNLMKFVLCVCLAILFHKTAVLILPLYWISKIKINNTYIFISLTGVIFVFLFGRRIVSILVSTLFPKYLHYINADTGGEKLLILFVLFIIFGAYFKEQYLREKENQLHFHMIIIGAVLQSFSLTFPLLGRAFIYYHISMIIFLPNMVASFNKKTNRVIISSAICLVTYMFYLLLLRGNDNGIVPYSLLFFD